MECHSVEISSFREQLSVVRCEATVETNTFEHTSDDDDDENMLTIVLESGVCVEIRKHFLVRMLFGLIVETLC